MSTTPSPPSSPIKALGNTPHKSAVAGKKRPPPIDDDDDDIILISDTPFEPAAKRLKTSHGTNGTAGDHESAMFDGAATPVDTEAARKQAQENKELEEEGFVILD